MSEAVPDRWENQTHGFLGSLAIRAVTEGSEAKMSLLAVTFLSIFTRPSKVFHEKEGKWVGEANGRSVNGTV